MSKQYRIEVYAKPLFDKQYLFRVFEVDYGSQASDYKETLILSGNSKMPEIMQEIKYWNNRSLNRG